MRPFQTETSLEKSKDLVEVATTLVSLNDCRQFLGMDHDVETANLCLWQAE